MWRRITMLPAEYERMGVTRRSSFLGHRMVSCASPPFGVPAQRAGGGGPAGRGVQALDAVGPSRGSRWSWSALGGDSFEHPDWVSHFDSIPALTVTTREHLLDTAIREKRLLIAFHLTACGYADRINAHYRFRHAPAYGGEAV